MRGQALVVEAAILLLVAVTTFILASHLFKVQYVASDYVLKINAQRILINWTDSGLINAIVFGYAGSGDPTLAREALEFVIPPNFGYNLTVLDLDGRVIFTVARGYDHGKSEGATLILMRKEPRIVILRLSR